MIVRTLDDGCLLMINQTDHAKLSGTLAAHLAPYPFDVDALRLAYVYRRLPTAVYADEATFRLAYFGAPPGLRSFTFVQG